MNRIRIDHRGGNPQDHGAGGSSRSAAGCRRGESTPHPTKTHIGTSILTQDPRFQKILGLIPLYAKTDLPVLITGEPGTGKELVAEALWAMSPQAHFALVKFNCAAIVESVANSELFGHVRGAFTDAHRAKKGKFWLAHGGTLFLDEIGDLPLSVQPRLLRAVEQGEIELVGGEMPLMVDVRLIAATNQDLRALLHQGKFRRDLYDRFSTLLIHLPPLRDRTTDITLLANYFARITAQNYGLGPVYLSAAVEKKLQDYHWPGNIRELKNVITRAVLLRQDTAITNVELDQEELPTPTASATPAGDHPEVPTLPIRLARQELELLLLSEQGNISAISRRLKVCTKTIYRWLKHYGIELDQFRQSNGF